MTIAQQLSMFGQPVARGEVTFPTPTARRSDIDTAHEAAKLIAFRASHDQIVALRALAEHEYLTDFDLERITGIKQTSVGKRRYELVHAEIDGHPNPLAEMATDEHGDPIKLPVKPGSTSTATAWRITAAGRTYLKEHDHA